MMDLAGEVTLLRGLLETIRESLIRTGYYQASSSEMAGNMPAASAQSVRCNKSVSILYG